MMTGSTFELAIEASGVKDDPWHCNRHTFDSRLVMAGVDLCTIAELMGHRTIQKCHRIGSSFVCKGMRKWRNWQTHQT